MLCAQCHLAPRHRDSLLCAICLEGVEMDRTAFRKARRVTDDDLLAAAKREAEERKEQGALSG